MDRHDRDGWFNSQAHVDDISAHRPGASGTPAPGELHIAYTLLKPGTAYSDNTTVEILKRVPGDITIGRLEVELNTADYEVTGDLMYADDFQDQANAAVINDFDTTSGKRDDSSITSGEVASGKCLYISFDAEPDSNITSMNVIITFNYD